MTDQAQSLVSVIDDYIATKELNLPVFSTVATRIQQQLSNENFGISDLVEIVKEDQALSSEVLRVANSAFFAGLGKVSNLTAAATRLGAKQLAGIVMMVTQRSLHQSTNPTITEYMTALWRHALGCAIASKWLAENCSLHNLSDDAFMAGLLHDIGKLYILKVLDGILESDEYDLDLTEATMVEILYTMHCDQGARLMEQWNLPEAYAEVAKHHHSETYDHSNKLLTIVRLANMTCSKEGISMMPDDSLILIATSEAQDLGISEIRLGELQILLEDTLNSFMSGE